VKLAALAGPHQKGEQKTVTADLTTATTQELFAGYAAILDELRRRGIVRSTNNPLSDLAEYLFCQAFGWRLNGKSTSGFDATDPAGGIRYQIKARRLTENQSRQLSFIRELDKAPFDYLAGLLMNGQFQVLRAAIVPLVIVQARARYVQRVNAWFE
jgi:hypothetical protein